MRNYAFVQLNKSSIAQQQQRYIASSFRAARRRCIQHFLMDLLKPIRFSCIYTTHTIGSLSHSHASIASIAQSLKLLYHHLFYTIYRRWKKNTLFPFPRTIPAFFRPLLYNWFYWIFSTLCKLRARACFAMLWRYRERVSQFWMLQKYWRCIFI